MDGGCDNFFSQLDIADNSARLDRQQELELIKQELTTPVLSSPVASSRTLGRPDDKTKSRATRSRASTATSSISSVSSITESPPASMYGARHAGRGTTPTSSLALPSVLSSRSVYGAHRTERPTTPTPSFASASAQSSPRAVSRPSSAYPSTSNYTPSNASVANHKPFTIYGRHSDDVLMREELPRRLHKVLHDVEDQYSVGEWSVALRAKIPYCTVALAEALAEAMKLDCGQSQ